MNSSNKAVKNQHPIKTLLLGSTLLLSLVLAGIAPAQADGQRGSEWRIGDHNQIFLRTDHGWHRVQGSAIAIADGWVIGTDRRSGGYGIYRWNGYNFDRMPGGAVQIGGSYEHPWVVNNRGERFEWAGRDWREVRTYNSHRNERAHERRYDRRDDEHDDHRDDNQSDHRDERRRPSW